MCTLNKFMNLMSTFGLGQNERYNYHVNPYLKDRDKRL